MALVARIIPGERIVDDAYITFRYARNIVEGHGFVYNRGEPVLGTTTPLYTLLLAVLSWLLSSRDFPSIAIVVNAAAGAASVGLLYALGKQVIGHWAPAAAAALLWAVAPYSVAFAIGGMETDLTIALLLGVAYAHVRAHPRWIAVLSALAFLARPDTVILLGLVWLDRILEQRRIPWQEGAIGLGLLAPWLIFATLTFGNPIPGSIAAKSVTYRLSPLESLVRLVQHYSTPFFGHHLFGSGWQLAGLIIYLLLSALGGMRAVRRQRHGWPLLAYPFVYLAVFSVANPLLFRWYLSPPLPFYVLFILAGVWSLAGDIQGLVGGWLPRILNRRDAERVDEEALGQSTDLPVGQIASLVLLTIAALILTLNAWELHPDHGPDRPAPKMAWFKLELLYARAADAVLAAAEPGDTLCAADIGTLGYLTDMHILDTVGLVTPEARRYYPADPDIYVTNYAIPADLVLAFDPDFMVILEVYGRRGLLLASLFRNHYTLVTEFETTIYGSSGMLVFRQTP